MTTIGITGIGGFIGKRLAERAVERGDRVRGIERSAEGAARVHGEHVTVVVGDIHDPEAVRESMAGCDVVVHTAAIVEEGGDLAVFRHVNVEGATAVARAARDAGVKTFVHLSSVMVYGFSFPTFVNEDGPLRGEDNAYCTTKIESEAAVGALATPRFGVVVIRPGDVYGVGSVPWVERPLALLRRRIFQLPDRGRGILNHVHVDNLIDGIFAAIDRERHGETFNLTDGRATTTREFFGYHARMLGMSEAPALPTNVLRIGLGALERAYELAGKAPPARAAALDYLLRPHAYGIGRARVRLDFEPRVRLEDGMVDIAHALGLRDPTPLVARPGKAR